MPSQFQQLLKPIKKEHPLPLSRYNPHLSRVPPTLEEARAVHQACLIQVTVENVTEARMRRAEVLVLGEQHRVRSQAVKERWKGVCRRIRSAYRGFIKTYKVQRARMDAAEDVADALESNRMNVYLFRDFRSWVEENAPDWLPDVEDAMGDRYVPYDTASDSSEDIDEAMLDGPTGSNGQRSPSPGGVRGEPSPQPSTSDDDSDDDAW
eukprot:PhM_4_TR17910/c0_g1_i2/m.10915